MSNLSTPGVSIASPVPDRIAGLVRLQQELGSSVSVDVAELESSRSDYSGWQRPGRPLAIVSATTTEQVQTTLRVATEFGLPVVTRGAGTGLAGGACGADGSIVLSVAGMNQILEIRPEDELAVVQPGVINQHLNDALAEHGLWFAPDPASKAISTVGGNIATNAGGLLCVKYGVTREAVLALTVVLADGTLLKTGHRTVKGVTGYDLTALLTGSEGTLGVIVEATVRVRTITPGDVVTLAAVFPDVQTAAAACAQLLANRVRPAVLELLDPVALGYITTHLGEDSFVRAGLTLGHRSETDAFVLLQTDGTAALVEAEQAGVLLREAGGQVQVAASAEQGERLLAIRRAMHPALAKQGQVLIEDVSVPRSRMIEMFEAIAEISRRTGIPIPTVAHAGDGNLHPNFVIPAEVPGVPGGQPVPDSVWAAADELFRAALRLGGTLTGEHGVGVLKQRWLADELGDTNFALQRRIKTAFDPQGILNPGTMFSE